MTWSLLCFCLVDRDVILSSFGDQFFFFGLVRLSLNQLVHGTSIATCHCRIWLIILCSELIDFSMTRGVKKHDRFYLAKSWFLWSKFGHTIRSLQIVVCYKLIKLRCLLCLFFFTVICFFFFCWIAVICFVCLWWWENSSLSSFLFFAESLSSFLIICANHLYFIKLMEPLKMWVSFNMELQGHK